MNSHAEVQELLPWFVNGSLNEGEQSMVDTHLEECGECRVTVQELVGLSAKFSSPDQFDERWRKDASNDFMKELSRQAGAGEAAWFRPMLAVCGALAVAAILLVGIPRTDAFLTLSRTEAQASPSPVVQVVFAPNTPEKTIREI
ncbi:MAG TPA: zf-HC2 domain-containing protein, partial [Pseudomonadales bacterium]|nr:zf-HC2 domain-containing protein [Pseudomonadales bacterium]